MPCRKETASGLKPRLLAKSLIGDSERAGEKFMRPTSSLRMASATCLTFSRLKSILMSEISTLAAGPGPYAEIFRISSIGVMPAIGFLEKLLRP